MRCPGCVALTGLDSSTGAADTSAGVLSGPALMNFTTPGCKQRDPRGPCVPLLLLRNNSGLDASMGGMQPRPKEKVPPDRYRFPRRTFAVSAGTAVAK